MLAFEGRALQKKNSDTDGDESSAAGKIGASDGELCEQQGQNPEDKSRSIKRKDRAALTEPQI